MSFFQRLVQRFLERFVGGMGFALGMSVVFKNSSVKKPFSI